MYPIEVELVDWSQGGEDTIVHAARTCYQSHDKSTLDSDDRLLKHLIESGHHAMLEFGWVALRIRCSRVVSHELVRSRLFSFAMQSQRYVNESEPDYVTPEELGECPYPEYAKGLYDDAMHMAWNVYRALLESKVPKQIARYVLPNSCMTELVVAGNYRQWRHFCELRTSPKAQPEMQEVAKGCLAILKTIAPRVFGGIE
jgi:thymidylate synthase (FAD)